MATAQLRLADLLRHEWTLTSHESSDQRGAVRENGIKGRGKAVV
jgi:hypothetical protein